MRKWEFLAAFLAVATLVGVPAGVFAYEAYRESQLPPGLTPHRAPALFVPQGDVAAGRQVFAAKCTACHGADAHGGVGPDLHRVANGGATFLYAFILDPKTVNTQASMPHVALSEKEVVSVVAFLRALPALPAEAIAVPLPTAVTRTAPALDPVQIVAWGQALFVNKTCAACHGPNAAGTAIAPALGGLSADKMRAQVRQPRDKMPAFSTAQLSDEELNAIIQYLVSLK